MADTSVKYFHSAMAGAPTLSGTAGALIAVLDACLKDGFGAQTVTSIVVASGIATVTLSGSNPFDVYSVALVSGATPSGLNGEKRVLSSAAGTFTFDATGISDQTATGTISVKLAPAGWAKPYSSSNLAAYKPTDVAASGCLLRVDDTGTVNARVVGYETMSDVNTGTGPFPTATQMSGGLYWAKSNLANTTSRNWVVIADSRAIYVMVSQSSGSVTCSTFGFGDVISFKSGDAYGVFINGGVSDESGALPGNSSAQLSNNNSSSGTFSPRSYTQLGTSIASKLVFPQFGSVTAATSGSTSYTMPYPNPADGALYATQYYMTDVVSGVLRGTLPGFYCVPQAIPSGTFVTKDTVTGIPGMTGKALKAIVGNNGTALIDVTGPWR